MNYNISRNEAELLVAVEGELNTVTSPLLEKQLLKELDGITSVVFDFSQLEYISSAGLRLLFCIQAAIDEENEVIVRSPNENVKKVFLITGASDILTIE